MMWRYLLGVGAVLLLGLAGIFFLRAPASSEPSLPAAPRAATATGNADAEDPLPDEAPRASARTREEKRFDRYDKDRNESITREEYLLSRRKAFAKLDADHDGRLGFEEWAAKTTTKFAGADGDKSGALTRPEFATTAPKVKARKPSCVCKPASPERDEGD